MLRLETVNVLPKGGADTLQYLRKVGGLDCCIILLYRGGGTVQGGGGGYCIGGGGTV